LPAAAAAVALAAIVMPCHASVTGPISIVGSIPIVMTGEQAGHDSAP